MKLKEFMEANNLTATALIERLPPEERPPVACVTRFIRGERGLSPKTAEVLSKASNGKVSIEELLYPAGVSEPARVAAVNQ